MDAEGGGQKRAARTPRVALPPRLNPTVYRLLALFLLIFLAASLVGGYEYGKIQYHRGEEAGIAAGIKSDPRTYTMPEPPARDDLREFLREHQGKTVGIAISGEQVQQFVDRRIDVITGVPGEKIMLQEPIKIRDDAVRLFTRLHLDGRLFGGPAFKVETKGKK